ncbi:MAG: hypothetical protein NC918_08300 [Candidatus Omnitrophica bacterium]|nr:hypothetical protein [Candidatus Omnitrophota bacterium]
MDEKDRKQLFDGVCPFCGVKVRFIIKKELGGSMMYFLFLYNDELKILEALPLDDFYISYFCERCEGEFGYLTDKEVKTILRNGSRG